MKTNKSTIIFISLITLFSFALGGCRAYVATSASGKADVSYILVLRDYGSHVKKADIQIDEQEPIKLKKIKKEAKSYKAKPYPITPGKHNLKIMIKSEIWLDEQIYLGVQETKKIVIPHKNILQWWNI